MAFVKNIYSKQFNIDLKKKTYAGILANGKFSQDVAGDTLEIETLGTAVGQDYVDGTINYGKLTNTTKTVTLDQEKVFPYKIGSLDSWKNGDKSISLQDATREAVSNGVAELLDTYLFTSMVAKGTGSLDLSTVDIDETNVLQVLVRPIVAKMVGVPKDKRFLVVNGVVASYLQLANILKTNKSFEETDGYIGSIMGIQILESELLPANTAIGVNPDAYALGMGLQQIDFLATMEQSIDSAIRHFLKYGGDVVSTNLAKEIIVVSLKALV